MREIISRYRNELLSIPLLKENEEKIRETAQLIITNIRLNLKNKEIKEDNPEINSAISECLTRLKKLRMITIDNTKEIELFNCRLDLFLSEISNACDLILSLKNKRVLFSAVPVFTAMCPPLLRDAVLVLISRAAQSNKRINVSLNKTRSRILIIIEAAKISIDPDSDSLYTVNHIMKLHGGNLFFARSKLKFKAVLSLPIVNGGYDEYPVPDFAEYVCDKMSAVRILLCE